MTEEEKVREADDQVMEVVDVTKPAASSELVSHVGMAKGRVQKAMCTICPFHNLDFGKLVDDGESTDGSFLSDSVYFLLIDMTYTVGSASEEDNYHYDVLIFVSMVAAVALCKRVMRPGARSHPFCFALRGG